MGRLYTFFSNMLVASPSCTNQSLPTPAQVRQRGAALAAALSIFFLMGLVEGVPRLTGDGWEYYLMTSNWAEHGKPWVDGTAAAKLSIARTHPEIIRMVPRLYTPGGNRYDSPHFWLYALFVSPFFHLCNILHVSTLYSFLLFHAFLFAICALLVLREYGRWGLAIFVGFVLACPMVWYVTKAHTEFYTFSLLFLAILFLRTDRVLLVALCVALLSAQNMTFGVFLAGILVFWVIRSRQASLSVWDAILLTGTVVIALAQPVYYLSRYYSLNPLALGGHASIDAITFQKALSLFIDPDIGLFPNWPLGLFMLALAVFYRRAMIELAYRYRSVAVFSLTFFIVMPFLQSTSVNWNSGGTVSVSRYALWYLPVFLFWILESNCYGPAPIAALKGRVNHNRIALMLVTAVGLVLGIVNLYRFLPGRGEEGTHTAFANWFYNRCPDCYTPVPEVFAERSLGRELVMSVVANAGPWAYSNGDCTKLYVVSRPPAGAKAPGLPKPEGCALPVDGAKLARYVGQVLEADLLPKYVRVPAEVVRESAPIYVDGSLLLFSNPLSSVFLGRGWSIQEPQGRWTDGRTAEILLNRVPEAQRLSDSDSALLLLSGALLKHGGWEPDVELLVDGRSIGRLDDRHLVGPDTYGFEIAKLDHRAVSVTLQIHNPRPRHTGPDLRQLGFYLRALSLLPAIKINNRVVPGLPADDCVDFANVHSLAYLGSGWSAQEPYGRWSDGTAAVVRFWVPRSHAAVKPKLLVSLSGAAFTRHADNLRGLLRLNGVDLGKFSLPRGSDVQQLRYSASDQPGGLWELELRFDNPKPPSWGGDPRRLGFYAQKLCLAAEKRTQ